MTLDQHGFELCLAVSSYQLQQLSCCISLLAEPGDKEWVEAGRKLKGLGGTADMFTLSSLIISSLSSHRHAAFSCGWPSGHSYNAASRAFRVELIYVFRTKVARGQRVHVTCTRSAECSQLVLYTHHVFTARGVRVRGRGRESLTVPSWLICSSPTYW